LTLLLISIVPQVDELIYVVKQHRDNPKDNLTPDESDSMIEIRKEKKISLHMDINILCTYTIQCTEKNNCEGKRQG
jgi:hypothetical protein